MTPNRAWRRTTSGRHAPAIPGAARASRGTARRRRKARQTAMPDDGRKPSRRPAGGARAPREGRWSENVDLTYAKPRFLATPLLCLTFPQFSKGPSSFFRASSRQRDVRSTFSDHPYARTALSDQHRGRKRTISHHGRRNTATGRRRRATRAPPRRRDIGGMANRSGRERATGARGERAGRAAGMAGAGRARGAGGQARRARAFSRAGRSAAS